MNVLVEISGKQFKVDKGDKIKVPYINKKVGEKLTFEKVLYIEDGKSKEIGTPYIKEKNIEAKILEHGSYDKVIVFKMKRRKGYQKKNGHKQKFSLVEISNLVNAKKTTTKDTATKKTATKKTTTKKADK